jgi:NADH-quinone oxidoreductase subunit C
MSGIDPWLVRVHAAFETVFAEEVSIEDGFGPIAVDVPSARWLEAVSLARDELGCVFFDWLSAVDELTDGFRVVCHLAGHRPGRVEHLILRTLVAREATALSSVSSVFAGARWHERETHEMFGISFTLDGSVLKLAPLLLPESFEGHPLRKDFILASRVAQAWPGSKEPGESSAAGHGPAPSRRRTRPPGVPEPEEWGPREPGSEEPDTLGAVGAGSSSRRRRTPRVRSSVEPVEENRDV